MLVLDGMMLRLVLLLGSALVSGQSLVPCPVECECSFTMQAEFLADCSARDLYQLPDGLDPQVISIKAHRIRCKDFIM